MGLLGGASGKEPACQYRRHKRQRFDPWVGKIPWRRPATHTGILAWRIPGTEEPGGPQSVGSHRVRHLTERLSRHTTLLTDIGHSLEQ